MQLLLVGALHTQLADEAGTRVFGAVDLLEVLLIDRADVADRVNPHFAQRVMPRQPRANIHARELVAMHGEARHLLLVQEQFDRHALVDLVQQHGTPDIAHLFAAQKADAHQLRQRGIQRFVVAHLLAHQLDIEGGHVVRQHHAVTVEDQASTGRDRLGANAVALRETMVIVELDDLQIEQTSRDRQQQHRRKYAGHDASNRKQPILSEIVFDPRLAASHHCGSAVCLRIPGMPRL